MERLEDKIVEVINSTAYEFDAPRCYKYAEFTYGDIGGNITINFEWHSAEDWQYFDWGYSLVQTEDVVDGIDSIEVECWDDKTGERVIIDYDYLLEKIDV